MIRPALAALAMLAAIAAPPASAAETPLSGAAFEALVSGRTLSYAVGGVAYGTEQYLPGRRVIWSFVGGPCRFGLWSEPAPGRICFVYDHEPAPQCWQFFDDPAGLRARFEGDPPGSDLVEVGRTQSPLSCPGPDVGA
jgi:hypothetical protein